MGGTGVHPTARARAAALPLTAARPHRRVRRIRAYGRPAADQRLQRPRGQADRREPLRRGRGPYPRPGPGADHRSPRRSRPGAGTRGGRPHPGAGAAGPPGARPAAAASPLLRRPVGEQYAGRDAKYVFREGGSGDEATDRLAVRGLLVPVGPTGWSFRTRSPVRSAMGVRPPAPGWNQSRSPLPCRCRPAGRARARARARAARPPRLSGGPNRPCGRPPTGRNPYCGWRSGRSGRRGLTRRKALVPGTRA